jgi:uncharacterized protein YneR
MKTEWMRSIQQAVQKNLTTEQQSRFKEELNRVSDQLRVVIFVKYGSCLSPERRGGNAVEIV